MGCAPSQHGHNSVNGYQKQRLCESEYIDPETGEREFVKKCGKGDGNATLSKAYSLNINDESEKHARTGEEPARPLPEAEDYGDMQLGITVSYVICQIPHFVTNSVDYILDVSTLC